MEKHSHFVIGSKEDTRLEAVQVVSCYNKKGFSPAHNETAAVTLNKHHTRLLIKSLIISSISNLLQKLAALSQKKIALKTLL
jgi:hypothetical protein